MAKASLRAYNREIESMIDRGHLDEAIANCRHILKTFPKHLETYRLLGKAYLEYKRYPEAVDIFSRVLAAVPDDFVANVGMSIIRDEENKLDDAIWHMERAFETQPSNAAIQGELQRLYGRRDGIQPPRIRMTRGALAHMYVQGELYPQAISEIKSVLKEDPGRVDMQALLARACYRSGLKNEAADVASSVLRTYPYCLDANRVLVEILGSDRSESAQAYRQRVVELDPYAAHVTGTIFQSNEAPEAAVNIERLDWNGQPVALQPGWETTEAIGLEQDKDRDEQPDWLKSVFDEQPTEAAEESEDRPAVVPPFEVSEPSGASTEPSDDIPDFLREAGWGQSTGSFDESKVASGYEEPDTEPPIQKGELPDWVKAMAPAEATESPDEEEEELPDWINKIGTGVPSEASDSDNQLDWIRQLDQPAQEQPSDDRPDWLQQANQPEQTIPLASDDQPEWLKGLESQSESARSEQPDWASPLDQPAQKEAESQPLDEQPDWLKDLDQSDRPEQPDWLKGFGSESEPQSAEDPDWLKQMGEQAEWKQPEISSTETDEKDEPAAVPASDEMDVADPTVEQSAEALAPLSEPDLAGEVTEEPQEALPAETSAFEIEKDSLGTSEQERDDSFAWLESLAAKQGTSEGLLTSPEERMDEEPDWIKRARGLSPDQTPAQAPESQPAEKIEELGKSEQERDDSFAWLESLAARQGASEGLLTTPEERVEDEPDWIKRARELGTTAEQPPVSPPAAAEEISSTEDTAMWLRSLDKEDITSDSQSEEDATGIWLKSLDEGPAEIQAEKPTERPEPELPEWMQTTEDQGSAEATAPSAATEGQVEQDEPARAAEQPESQTTTRAPAGEDEQTPEAAPAAIDHEITVAADQAEEQLPAQMDDLPEWMQFIEDKETAEETILVTEEQEVATETSEWMGSIEEPVAASEARDSAEEKPTTDSEEIPAWLSSLEEEEDRTMISIASDEGLPAWLRGEEGTAPESSELEPTQATDWQPVEEKQPELEPVSEARSEPVEAAQERAEAAEPSAEDEKEEAAIPTPEPAAELQKEPVAPIEEAMASMPVDPILGRAREDLSSGDIAGALKTYGKLIRKTRLLDEVIHDLREALYRYPVDVEIWQALGDAYMRANRLQDALDAYTKAEELLR